MYSRPQPRENWLTLMERAVEGNGGLPSYRKPGLLGHFGHFGQYCHFGHLGQPFPSQGGHADKKSHLESGLNQQDEAAAGFIRQTNPNEAEKKNLDRGCEITPRGAFFVLVAVWTDTKE